MYHLFWTPVAVVLLNSRPLSSFRNFCTVLVQLTQYERLHSRQNGTVPYGTGTNNLQERNSRQIEKKIVSYIIILSFNYVRTYSTSV